MVFRCAIKVIPSKSLPLSSETSIAFLYLPIKASCIVNRHTVVSFSCSRHMLSLWKLFTLAYNRSSNIFDCLNSQLPSKRCASCKFLIRVFVFWRSAIEAFDFLRKTQPKIGEWREINYTCSICFNTAGHINKNPRFCVIIKNGRETGHWMWCGAFCLRRDISMCFFRFFFR